MIKRWLTERRSAQRSAAERRDAHAARQPCSGRWEQGESAACGSMAVALGAVTGQWDRIGARLERGERTRRSRPGLAHGHPLTSVRSAAGVSGRSHSLLPALRSSATCASSATREALPPNLYFHLAEGGGAAAAAARTTLPRPFPSPRYPGPGRFYSRISTSALRSSAIASRLCTLSPSAPPLPTFAHPLPNPLPTRFCPLASAACPTRQNRLPCLPKNPRKRNLGTLGQLWALGPVGARSSGRPFPALPHPGIPCTKGDLLHEPDL